jgi:hypothetical protein
MSSLARAYTRCDVVMWSDLVIQITSRSLPDHQIPRKGLSRDLGRDLARNPRFTVSRLACARAMPARLGRLDNLQKVPPVSVPERVCGANVPIPVPGGLRERSDRPQGTPRVPRGARRDVQRDRRGRPDPSDLRSFYRLRGRVTGSSPSRARV